MVRRIRVVTTTIPNNRSRNNSPLIIKASSNNDNNALLLYLRFLLLVLSIWFIWSSTIISQRYYNYYYNTFFIIVPNNNNSSSSNIELGVLDDIIDVPVVVDGIHSSSSTTSPTSSSTSTTTSSTTTTARVCLMYKPLMDNNFQDLEEWIDYQFAIGFTSIRIFNYSPKFDLEKYLDDNDDNENNNVHNDKRHKHISNIQSKIKITHLDYNQYELSKRSSRGRIISPQNFIYEQCLLESINDNITWVGTFDVDEFLVLKKHDTVTKFMDDVCPSSSNNNNNKCGQISITMRVFGHSNLTKYEPLIPVTKRFQYYVDENLYGSNDKSSNKKISYAKELTTHIKSIVNPNAVRDKLKWFHAFPLIDRYKSLTPDGNIQPSHNGHKKMLNLHVVGKNKGKDIAALHHYTFKSSMEEYYKQCQRGDGISGIINNNNNKCNNLTTTKTTTTATTTGDATTTNNNNDDGYKKYLDRKYNEGDIIDNAGMHYDDSAWEILKLKVPSKYK